ncbi:SGNH family esterase protein [Rhizobium gallicum bv. gallicum R602sp]|uniref:SGNH family esterase protein n=3 Tax=Rhizobium TaxID=379 RepID=A0A0B4X854_9HYPH|nr:SGNH family esterase protein [Rhizobium gallicum bv. gallicum R602sp]
MWGMAMRRSGNRLKLGWRTLLSAALMLSFGITAPVDFADAQERYYYRRSIFDFFTGRRYINEDYAPPPEVRRPPQRQRKRPPLAPKPPTVATARPVAPVLQEPVVQKLENAQKILIVGDFLASGLGDGMTEAFKTSPGVIVEARGNVSSGLVRDDYYDWPEQLLKIMDELKPAMVVVMIGANDRQQMVIGGAKEKFRTDAWYGEYQKRVLNFGKEITNRKIPLLWVGLPAFESPSMTADAVQMNQLYRKQVESIGGEFVDIWDGFVDENGQFVVTGSDINGQQVRLRTSDGINLTQAGRRKVAFYVEKPARRLLGAQASPDLVRLDTSNLPHLGLPSDPVAHTQPISLSDPNLDGGVELLGGRQPPATLANSPRDKLVQEGKMDPAPLGRVDDYSLPAPKEPKQVSTK